MEGKPVIGVRVDPGFRAEIKAGADRYHDGSESAVLRAGAKLYLLMRDRLGPQFEPTLMALWGISLHEPADEREVIAV